MNRIKPPPQRAFVPPSQLVWDDERLSTLDKDQLANLLINLRTQLELGRISEETATDLEQRIRSRLPKAALARLQRDSGPPVEDDHPDRQVASNDE